jgi:hypothetical protein
MAQFTFTRESAPFIFYFSSGGETGTEMMSVVTFDDVNEARYVALKGGEAFSPRFISELKAELFRLNHIYQS